MSSQGSQNQCCDLFLQDGCKKKKVEIASGRWKNFTEQCRCYSELRRHKLNRTRVPYKHKLRYMSSSGKWGQIQEALTTDESWIES